jgi:hypothetical protein
MMNTPRAGRAATIEMKRTDALRVRAQEATTA